MVAARACDVLSIGLEVKSSGIRGKSVRGTLFKGLGFRVSRMHCGS